MDGKWALHPDQVAIANEVYSPAQKQFDLAVAILDAYRVATEEEGRGAVMLNGEMIDEAEPQDGAPGRGRRPRGGHDAHPAEA